jgi:hypothetical protein
MATTRSIYQMLEEAAERLSNAANDIRDLPVEPRTAHIRRIGNALSEIFEIQYHLQASEPELTPRYLKGPFEKPENAWGVAVRHARAAEEAGSIPMAIAILNWFASEVGATEYEQRARREIERLRGDGDA